jgi:DNA polymerase-1
MFYLLDGHALAYRHHFAHINNPLVSSKGEPTSAVFGFSRTLMDILEKDKPFYLSVSFDEGLSGRDELYSEYKGTREKMPDELAQQMIRIRQIVEAFNIPILSLPGYEADDLLGTASLQAEAQGVDVRIITGDRDLLQLLTDNTTVRLAIPQRGAPDEIYDVAKFRDKYGLEPVQLIDLKALEGDTSDNIPGVAGIGRVGATKLLQQYPSLETIYEHIDEIKGALQKKLIEGRESAFLSKQLATIRRDVPVQIELSSCIAHDFDKARVELLYRELEFGSMFNQLSRIRVHDGGQLPLFGMEADADEEQPPVEAVFPTVTVQDMGALQALVDTLNAAQAIAFDVETTSTDQMAGDLVGISLSVDGETGYYIPLAHLSGDQLSLETVIDALRPPLTNPNIPKYAHNATYDVVMLQRHGIDVAPVTFDTMVAEWLRDPLSSNLSLKRLAAVDLGVNMTPISALIGTGKKQRLMTEVPIDQAAAYAAADAVCTYKLVGVLRGKLEREPDAPSIDPLWGTENPPSPLDVFNDLEMPLIPVVSALDRAGVLLDSEYLAHMSTQLAADLAALEQEIYTLGEMGQFNINSPKQLNDVLFGKLGLRVEGLRKTTHGYSTAADVLDSMRGEHPIIEQLLQYRELSKLKGTYVDALPALVNAQTGRLHTSYNQTGTVTGRLSSSSPNLQNIPIRTDKGREVRRAFIAPPGKLLLAVDYSQVELRIMAHAAKEPALIDSFHQGLDIHAATAALVNNIPLEQVSKDQRNFAKRVNFGLLYGMGAFRLARDSGLPLAQAEAFINTYFARLPRVKDYIENAKRIAREQGYLTTLYGRRRSFPGLKHGNRNIQQQAEREAINMPIQGTAADIIKKAMIDLYAELNQRKLGAQMILQVHDELVLEVPENQLREMAALVVDVMERACELDAPLRTNAEYGHNWLEVETI